MKQRRQKDISERTIHTVRVRVPLHLLNVLERAAVTENKTISKVVREMIETHGKTYIGINDHNGQKIHLGDRLKFTFPNNEEQECYTVTLKNGSIVCISDNGIIDYDPLEITLSHTDLYKAEVIS